MSDITLGHSSSDIGAGPLDKIELSDIGHHAQPFLTPHPSFLTFHPSPGVSQQAQQFFQIGFADRNFTIPDFDFAVTDGLNFSEMHNK